MGPTEHTKQSETSMPRTCGKRNRAVLCSSHTMLESPAFLPVTILQSFGDLPESLSVNGRQGSTPRFCNFQPGNLFHPSGSGHSAIPRCRTYRLLPQLRSRERQTAALFYLKKNEPAPPGYLVFSLENADYFKQRFRIFFLFYEMEGLILLKTHSFSQECP